MHKEINLQPTPKFMQENPLILESYISYALWKVHTRFYFQVEQNPFKYNIFLKKLKVHN